MPLMILDKKTNEFKFYSTLKNNLMNDFPELDYETLVLYLTRLKKPFEDENYIIYKGDIKKSQARQDQTKNLKNAPKQQKAKADKKAKLVKV